VATIELPSDTETTVTREFDFPPELVFDMWTDPLHVPHWYGMRAFIMSDCQIDLRVGGRWRWAQRDFEGREIAFAGVYREIDRPHLLAFTEQFEALPDSEYLVTMTFEAHGDGATFLTTHMLYQTREHRDGHLQSGMEEGTNAVYAQLDEAMTAASAVTGSEDRRDSHE
jgi:uncharacterized protein YndB with AHSA1/START domain